MPDKKDSTRPKIKVEEVEEEKTQPTPKPKEKEVSSSEDHSTGELPQKIVSFSQLDSVKPFEESKGETPSSQDEAKESNIQEETTSQTPNEPKKQISSEEIKEWLQEVRPDTTKEFEKSRGIDLKLVILTAFIFIILGAVAGGVFYYQRSLKLPPKDLTNQNQNEEKILTSPTPIPTTPIKQVDLTKFSLNVLNGSGKKGEAASVKTLLIEGGFSEEKISVGNAKTYDYKETLVTLKENVDEEVFQKIKESLPDYEIVRSEKPLDSNLPYDILIVIGSLKK